MAKDSEGAESIYSDAEEQKAERQEPTSAGITAIVISETHDRLIPQTELASSVKGSTLPALSSRVDTATGVTESLAANRDSSGFKSDVIGGDPADSMTLDDAISSGDCARMKDVLAGMSELEAQNQVQRCCRIPKDEQESALIQQAREGNVAMLLAVLTELWQRCTVQEILENVTDDSTMVLVERYVKLALIAAGHSRRALGWQLRASDHVPAQLQRVGTVATALHIAADQRISKVVKVLLPEVAKCDGLVTWQVELMIMNVLEHILDVTSILLESDTEKAVFAQAVKNLDVALTAIVSSLPAVKVESAFRRSLRVAMMPIGTPSSMNQSSARFALSVASTIFKHGGRPSLEDLNCIGWAQIGRVYTIEMVQDCFLGAVESARNPLVPGVTLSTALADSIDDTSEVLQRTFTVLKGSIDDLLMEVLKHLPQSVHFFPRGMTGCRELFEPETTGALPKEFVGPLRSLVQHEKQMRIFCSSLLVMDYLSRKFTRGLPNMRDSEGVVTDKYELSYLESEGFVSNAYTGQLLQGIAEDSRQTCLVGAQFVIAGVVAEPSKYYRVPWLRMLWDFISYAAMLCTFSTSVLHYHHGPLSFAEIGFAVYVLAALTREIREAHAGARVYAKDLWKVLHFAALLLLSSGLVSRVVNSHGTLARGLYALSAPVVVSRVLFFFQAFRFQGPMVQVIFAMTMTAELSRFAVVMFVLVLGFVMAFHALLLDTNITYGETWQGVFSGILGDTSIFDVFSGVKERGVSVVLLGVFFVITNIILLNLLIGLLTAEYERVRGKLDILFKIFKARLMVHYGNVVERDWLPVPLNLVQPVVSLPFMLADASSGTQTHRAARKAVGPFLFWLGAGVFVVPLGCMLWIASAPNVMMEMVKRRRKYADGVATLRQYRYHQNLLASHCIRSITWFVVGAPLCLWCFWLRVATRRSRITDAETVYQGTRNREGVDVPGILAGTREITMSRLRRCLENPMIDHKVQEDEKSQSVTMEHLKLLRDRLEGEIARENEITRRRIDERFARVERKMEES